MSQRDRNATRALEPGPNDQSDLNPEPLDPDPLDEGPEPPDESMNEITGTLVRLLARPGGEISWGVLTDMNVVRLCNGDRIVVNGSSGELRGTVDWRPPLWYLRSGLDFRLTALELFHTRAVRLVEPADGGSVKEAKAEPPLVMDRRA